MVTLGMVALNQGTQNRYETPYRSDYMGDKHRFRALAWWSAGRSGLTKCDSAPNAIHFTAPPEFGGFDGRWTPEELLLSAVASCFTATFQTIAIHSKFDYADLEVEAEGLVHRAESGYAFSEVIVRPTLTISKEEERERALMLLQKARQLCLVSRALSTEQKYEHRVHIAKLSPVS
jgi:peroxiredoxin-like protein